MTKTRVSITVDVENLEFARRNMVNISDFTNSGLYRMRISKKDDINALNYEIKLTELQKKEEKLRENTQEVEKLRLQVTDFKKKMDETELENKKKELEHLERLMHCGNCGVEIEVPIELKGQKFNLCLECLHQIPVKKREKFAVPG